MGLIAVMGMMSSMAFAEPAIQPGDTLESLSKARITTNVNSQVATPTPRTTVEAVVAPVASNELIVSVDDIDVAHPTE